MRGTLATARARKGQKKFNILIKNNDKIELRATLEAHPIQIASVFNFDNWKTICCWLETKQDVQVFAENSN